MLNIQECWLPQKSVFLNFYNLFCFYKSQGAFVYSFILTRIALDNSHDEYMQLQLFWMMFLLSFPTKYRFAHIILMHATIQNKLDADNCHTCGALGGCAAHLMRPGEEPARTTASGHAQPQPTRPGQTPALPAQPSRPGLLSIPSPNCRHRLPPLDPVPPSPSFSGCHGNQSRSVGPSHR